MSDKIQNTCFGTTLGIAMLNLTTYSMKQRQNSLDSAKSPFFNADIRHLIKF